MKDIGQKVEEWNEAWGDKTPEQLIQMWDYWSLRHWIAKFIPRNGKVIEAGCGLGRFNFYFSQFGIDIEGLDFSEPVVNFVKKWQQENNLNCKFKIADVTNLPYENNTINGYLSFGVVEHFIEGPKKPLDEAFRVLKPGGIAIVTTPSPSFPIIYFKLKKNILNFLNHIRGEKNKEEIFFQYYYSHSILKKFLQQSGFYVSRSSGTDFLFAFLQFLNYDSKKIDSGTFYYRLAHLLENTIFNKFGAQSVTISIKLDKIMHCFLCNKPEAKIDSLKKFDVPLCPECTNSHLSKHYSKNRKVKYATRFNINPPILIPSVHRCTICDSEFLSSKIFEDFGFTKSCCPTCLKEIKNNIELSNNFLKPIWRTFY